MKLRVLALALVFSLLLPLLPVLPAPMRAAAAPAYTRGDIDGDGSITATERTDQIPGQMNMDGGEEPLPTEVTFNVVQ